MRNTPATIELRGCAPTETQPATFDAGSATVCATDAQPTSLKAAALLVLRRNEARNQAATHVNDKRNSCATTTDMQRNSRASKASDAVHGIANSARSYGVTVEQLRDAAGDDWSDIVGDAEKVTAWAQLLADNRTRANGHVPSHYTQAGECAMCGPVWLWPGAEKVLACPWCVNRDKGLLIPRPRTVICQECRHYRRDAINPVDGFGSCAKRKDIYAPYHRSNCFAYSPTRTGVNEVTKP